MLQLPLPSSVVAGGAGSIVSYLKLNGDRTTAAARVKLMFVGQENVGKTSLLSCLKSGKGTKHTHGNNNPILSTDGLK